MKKLLCMLFSLALVVATLTPVALLDAEAATTASMSAKADKSTYNVGDTVTVTFSLDADLSDVKSGSIDVSYDSSVFTVNSSKKYTKWKLEDMAMNQNIDDHNKGAFAYDENWDIDAGAVYQLTLTAKAAGTDKNISATFIFKTMDSSSEEVVLASGTASTTVTVAGASCAHENTETRYDATQHWTYCTDCQQVVGEKVSHTFVQKSDGTNHWQECEVCGYKKDITAHTWQEKVLADGTNLKSAATCTSYAVYYKVCSVCGEISTTDTFEYEAGGYADHEWETTWTSNNLYHWHNCTNSKCTEVNDTAQHTFVQKSDATYYWQECSVCGYKKDITPITTSVSISATADKTTYDVGDTVTVTFSLDADLSNVKSGSIEVSYDSSVFTVNTSKKYTKWKLEDTALSSNIDDQNRGAFAYDENWDIEAGAVYQLTLTAKAAGTDKNISATFNFKTIDSNGQEVDFASCSSSTTITVKPLVPEGTPTITCTSKECNVGDTVTVDVNISNNPGVMAMQITPTYSSELGTPNVTNGTLFSSITKGKSLVWDSDEDVTTDGTLFRLTFKIGEDVEPGTYTVDLKNINASNYDEEEITFVANPATITVKAPVTGVSLDKTTATIKAGGTDNTVTLTPTITPAKATNKNVTWSSSDTSVATVTDGVVTAVKKGTTTITVKTEDGGYEASCVVTVQCGHAKTDKVVAPQFLKEAATCKSYAVYYKSCAMCGEKGSETFEDVAGGYAAHIWSNTIKEDGSNLKDAATRTSYATYYKVCSVCGEISDTETFEDIDGGYALGITIDSKTVVKGDSFTVEVKIDNNPGIAAYQLTPVVPTGLVLESVTGGELFSDITYDNNIIWLSSSGDNVEGNGILLTLTFSTNETTEEGEYTISFVGVEFSNTNEKTVYSVIDGGEITVIDFIYGDANGDGKVDLKDLVRLKKYLANYDSKTGTSTIEIGRGADANGDGKVDLKDLVRLKKYLANYDSKTGTSTVVLGPTK